MLVRLNVGRRAGEIQDIEPSAAKQMLADGRAEAVQYGQDNVEPEGVAKLATVAGEPAPSAKSAKRK